MNIVVIGGSGLIGKKLVTKLHERGHDAVAASPSSGVNAVTGAGLAEVLVDAEVVVDVTNSPSFEDAAVLEFFEKSSRNLLAAEATLVWVITLQCQLSVPIASLIAAICARKSLRRS